SVDFVAVNDCATAGGVGLGASARMASPGNFEPSAIVPANGSCPSAEVAGFGASFGGSAISGAGFGAEGDKASRPPPSAVFTTGAAEFATGTCCLGLALAARAGLGSRGRGGWGSSNQHFSFNQLVGIFSHFASTSALAFAYCRALEIKVSALT